MLVIKILLGFLGLAAMIHSFMGCLFAARDGMPVAAPRMKFYKWCCRGGLVLLAIDAFIIISDALFLS